MWETTLFTMPRSTKILRHLCLFSDCSNLFRRLEHVLGLSTDCNGWFAGLEHSEDVQLKSVTLETALISYVLMAPHTKLKTPALHNTHTPILVFRGICRLLNRRIG